MSFDLRIHFVGLNLFVPEDGKRMNVLLPASKCVDPHHARLIYDEAYTLPDQVDLTRRYAHIDIKGGLINFTSIPVAETAIETRLPVELPMIADFTTPVERRHVTGNPDPGVVTARIVVDSGALTFCGLGAFFHLPVSQSVLRTQRMAARTEWTIRGITSRESSGSGTRPVLPGQDLPGTIRKRLPNLYPIGDTIHLMIFHAVALEFPPHGEDFKILEQAHPAHHFCGYFAVCPPTDASIDHTPTPASAKDVVCSGDKVDKEGDETPGLTCVQAQARLAEDSGLREIARDECHHCAPTLPLGQHVV
jgi:hypothetical protein